MGRVNFCVHLTIILSVVVSLLLSGCATTKGNWQKATKINTSEAYEEFLRKHPESEFATTAKERIEQLAWKKAQDENTVLGYRKFLKEYPNSKFASQAEQRIEQFLQLAWQETQEQNTVEAYREFISKYPNSKFNEVVRKRIQNFEKDAWQIARKEDTVHAYEGFLEKNPESSFAEKAKIRLQEIIKPEFEKAVRDLSALEKFVRLYPIHVMPIKFQQGVEDRFIDAVLSSGVEGRFTIYDFVGVARSDIPERERGSITMFETGRSDIVGFKAEYPKDGMPFDAGGAYGPFGHGSVWRFKGRVENIGGFTFEGNKSDPLRFILVEGRGLVYLYGSGTVKLKDGTIVSLPRE